MLLWNHYRILWIVIKFGYKATHTKSDIATPIDQIKPIFMSKNAVFRNCCYMHRLGLIKMEEPQNGVEHRIHITDKGKQFAMDMRIKLAFGMIGTVLDLLALLIGFILGRL